jgi:hypothetical protein
MASTEPVPIPDRLSPDRLYENDARLGPFVYYSPSIKSWMQWRVDDAGGKLQLMGHGRQPSDVQVALWAEVEARLPELRQAAVNAAGVLLVGERADTFAAGELELKQVRFEEDGTIELLLDFPRNSLYMWPMVTLSDWIPTRVRWVV